MVVVGFVVKGNIFCLRLKACRESRGIAPFVIILHTRWNFGASIATCYGLEGFCQNGVNCLRRLALQGGKNLMTARVSMLLN